MSIKQLRTDVGLTQAVASKKLDITSDYLSMLETGKRTCSLKLINSMAKLYKVSPVDIFLKINRT